MKYTIKTVSSLTGISQHTIRAWERRHNVLVPERTESNRRLYSETDVERFKLLKVASDAGHSVGQLSKLSADELKKLSEVQHLRERDRLPNDRAQTVAQILDECQSSVNRLDPEGLRDVLIYGTALLGISELIEQVLVPLLQFVEDHWLAGSVSIAEEHMTISVLRTYLEETRSSIPVSATAPRLLVTTPSRQIHEIGALVVTITAALELWNVTYLGPNLPAIEIADAARRAGVSAVALSIVFPTDDEGLPSELRLLKNHLGSSVPILVGGRGTSSYTSALQEIGAIVCKDLSGFRESLYHIERG